LTTKLVGTGVTRSLSVTGLVSGKNDIYVYCNGDNLVHELNVIEITYDPVGPVLSDLVFLNNGAESDFLNSDKVIEFKFDSNSIIPIDKYFVEVRYSNFTELIEKSNLKTCTEDEKKVWQEGIKKELTDK
jgi:hypothetical protein